MAESSDQTHEAGVEAEHDTSPRQVAGQTDEGHASGTNPTTSAEGDSEKAGSPLGAIFSTLDFHIDPFWDAPNGSDPLGDAIKTIGTSFSESIARVFDGSVDADSMLGRSLEASRYELARQAGRSIERILKSRGIKKTDLDKKFKVTGKDRLADIIKGRLQPGESGRKSKPLDIELISDLCCLLDVPPSVLLGDIDEEEFMIIEKLRAMSDGYRAAVLQIINGLPNGEKD